MKETGIIRKIDELGRIVLPKEIRRSLGIKDGEDLEIFVDKAGIYLQKYSRLLPYHEIVYKLCGYSKEEMKIDLFITDREKVLTSTISEFQNHEVNFKLSKILEERETYESTVSENLFEDVSKKGYFFIIPIIVLSDAVGLIVLYHEQPFLSYMKNFANFLQKLIINKIDIL